MKRILSYIGVFAVAFAVGCVFFRFAEWSVSQFPLVSRDTVSVIRSHEFYTENDQYDTLLFDWRDSDDSAFEVKLLQTGEGFHGDEINANSDEVWLGLFKEGNNYYLANSKISIRPSYDAIVDEPGEKITGKEVLTAKNSESLFLLKNADFLSEGSVRTLDASPEWDHYDDESSYDLYYSFTLDKGFNRTYALNGINYRLYVLEVDDRRTLVLEKGDERQIIYFMSTTGDESWHLYWVGDLDGDGKLDLFANIPTFYNFSQKRLFLSSQADEGKLVKQVALFHTTGC